MFSCTLSLNFSCLSCFVNVCDSSCVVNVLMASEVFNVMCKRKMMRGIGRSCSHFLVFLKVGFGLVFGQLFGYMLTPWACPTIPHQKQSGVFKKMLTSLAYFLGVLAKGVLTPLLKVNGWEHNIGLVRCSFTDLLKRRGCCRNPSCLLFGCLEVMLMVLKCLKACLYSLCYLRFFFLNCWFISSTYFESILVIVTGCWTLLPIYFYYRFDYWYLCIFASC